MAKDKNKNKVPFNVFRKGLAGALIGATILAGGVSFAGCSNGQDGKDGKDGTAGTIWKAGTSYTEFTDAKVGDFFIDTDDYILYQKAETEWVVVMENYGKPGQAGAPGQDGPQGEKGDSVWFGYDGYLWIGENRTTYVYDADLVGGDVAENTLELYNTPYFEKEEVDTTANTVVLLSNYFEHIDKTFYSENTVTEISVYASQEGKLAIGTVDVAEAIAARTEGGLVEMNNVQLYDVKAGLNTIKVDIEVDTYETIALGGNGTTVSLYAATGLDADDQHGLYTVVDSASHGATYEETENIKNKLIVKVKKQSEKIVYRSLTPEMQAQFPISSLTSPLSSSYYYVDTAAKTASARYSGQTITRIDIPVYAVSNKDAAYFYMRLFKIDNSDESKLSEAGYPILKGNETFYDLRSKIQIDIPKEELDKLDPEVTNNRGIEVKKWISIKGLNIVIPEGYSVMFEMTENLFPAYTSKKGTYPMANYSQGNLLGSYSMCFDMYVSETVDMSNQLEELKRENELAGTAKLVEGKTISFLGDSISQNQLNEGNVTNADMWWKQVVDGLGLDLCVNNSISATSVGGDGTNAAWKDNRCQSLHTETKEPDIIGIFMGTNDMNRSAPEITDFEAIEAEGYVPSNFSDAYALMVYKIKQRYPDAVVVCMTIPDRGYDDLNILRHNKAIIAVAERYGCYVADGVGCGMNDETYNLYTYDGTHPNAAGMDLLTDAFVAALKEIYG